MGVLGECSARMSKLKKTRYYTYADTAHGETSQARRNTFSSKEEYENARGDKWWRVGDLSGKFVPWPIKDEQHARLNR